MDDTVKAVPSSLSVDPVLGGSFLVTGAAGCVGRALVDQLASEGGRVAGMDFAPRPVDSQTASWIEGDVCVPASFSDRLSGVDMVFHLAAKVHSVPRTHDDADQFWKVNLEGTRRLVEAAAAAGVRKFIYVSTVAVLSSRCGNLSDAYAESKLAAEKAVLEFRDRMDVIIVRPATVYGPNDRGNVYKLIRWIDKGFPPIIGSGANRKSMVYVRTLADALSFLSRRGEKGQAYVVTDGRDLSMNEIVEVICRALGTVNRWPAIPLPIARMASRANEWFSDSLGFPRISGQDTVEKLVDDTVHDPEALFSLGFSPAYSPEKGLAETVRWYKDSVH